MGKLASSLNWNLFDFDPGADVIHPSPGAEGRPSFTALVGNVDSDVAKYVAGQSPACVRWLAWNNNYFLL